MFNSEENKLDKLEQELLDIEKVAKNLDLNSKDEDRMVLTNIVSETQNVPKDQSKNDLINSLNNIKLNLNQQIKEINDIIKSFDK
ncbi:MAG: hypothetical protein EVA21_05075 [Alphaproteobacteria bacterium]|nr:MAG: hypothetical protein EVA21_05075 [Alphaproteobacteria bacterium]|tara:strand:+ start:883 stop:1137 length:255 start_codon:yes stop_codon:yes gene_type:complete